MPESFNFTWELFDKVSGAAEHIQRAMEKAEQAMKHAEGQSRHGLAAWSLMGIKMGAVAGVASGLTTAFMHLGGEAIGLAASGVKWALEAASFNENAMLSLEAVLGTKKAASEAMGEWRSIAEGTPFETRSVIEWGKQLRIAGESAENTVTILKAVSDLGTAMGSTPEQQAGFAGQALQALVNAKQVGIANERTLRVFRSLGVSPLKIEQNMAKRLTGGNIFALRNMMQEGLVSSFEETLAVLQAIQDTYGKLGNLSRKGSGTLSGLLTRVTDRPFDIFKGLENTAGYKALKGVLVNLADVLDPKSAAGKGLMAGVRDLSAGLGDFLKPLTGPSGKQLMVDFFRSMKEEIDKLLPGVRTLVEGAGFLAKWGILKPIEGLGYLSNGGAAQGMTMNEITGESGFAPGHTPQDAPRPVPFGSVGPRDRSAMPAPIIGSSGPGMLARSNVVTVQNTFHIHGDADTDALATKMDDLQQESFTAMLERLSLFGAGG